MKKGKESGSIRGKFILLTVVACNGIYSAENRI